MNTATRFLASSLILAALIFVLGGGVPPRPLSLIRLTGLADVERKVPLDNS